MSSTKYTQAKLQHVSVAIVIAAMIVLLLMLIGFDLFPFTVGNDELVIQSQANLQVARGEALAKSALMLSYPAFHLPAVSQLQIVEPQLEQTQIGLLKGNPSLGLPPPPDDVKLVLDQAGRPYADVTTAIKKLLASPDAPPDAIEVSIVVQSVDNYAGSMYQVAQILQQHAESRNLSLAIFKVVLKTLLIIVIAGHYLLAGRKILSRLVEVEAGSQTIGKKEAP